jgi:hypothetical protein
MERLYEGRTIGIDLLDDYSTIEIFERDANGYYDGNYMRVKLSNVLDMGFAMNNIEELLKARGLLK